MRNKQQQEQHPHLIKMKQTNRKEWTQLLGNCVWQSGRMTAEEQNERRGGWTSGEENQQGARRKQTMYGNSNASKTIRVRLTVIYPLQCSSEHNHAWFGLPPPLLSPSRRFVNSTTHRSAVTPFPLSPCLPAEAAPRTYSPNIKHFGSLVSLCPNPFGQDPTHTQCHLDRSRSTRRFRVRKLDGQCEYPFATRRSGSRGCDGLGAACLSGTVQTPREAAVQYCLGYSGFQYSDLEFGVNAHSVVILPKVALDVAYAPFDFE